MQDIQELKKSMEAASHFFSSNKNTLTKADEIAEAIINETLEFINEGVTLENLIFTYQDIYKMVWGKSETPEKASQSVRAHKEKLDSILKEDSELNTFLAEGKFQQLYLKSHRPSGHHKTTIGIVTNKTEPQIGSQTSTEFVRYFATDLPKPYLWTKPFLKIALNPSRIVIAFILSIVLGTLSVVVYFTFNIGMNEFIKFSLVLLFIASIYLISKLIELVNKGITSAPIFMAPITKANVFFVLHRPEQRKLEVLTVVFEGSCSICGDKLLIEKSREFKGRFIGKCAIAPLEHVFTFDHVTKTGRHLR